MSGPKTGVRLIGVTGWFECDGSGVHHEVCSFLSDGRATKSAVVCDSWEQAEQVLRDHEAMEALRGADFEVRGNRDRPTVAAFWDARGNLMKTAAKSDPATAILAAKEADSE